MITGMMTNHKGIELFFVHQHFIGTYFLITNAKENYNCRFLGLLRKVSLGVCDKS